MPFEALEKDGHWYRSSAHLLSLVIPCGRLGSFFHHCNNQHPRLKNNLNPAAWLNDDGDFENVVINCLVINRNPVLKHL